MDNMNLRILFYLNPSNFGKYSHKWKPNGDSGWVLAQNTIQEINRIRDYHFYLLVPDEEVWTNAPDNVSLIEYPYMNDAMNNRYHFDSKFLNDWFSSYWHDIDLVWTCLPENVGSIKAFLNKRREEIPICTYSPWLDDPENRSEGEYDDIEKVKTPYEKEKSENS